MELWIRSQDKKILKKTSNLFVCKYYDKYIISNYYNEYPNNDSTIYCDLVIYGYYKTEERALEVLGEIQNRLMPYSEVIQDIEGITISYKNVSTIIYEMPKE